MKKKILIITLLFSLLLAAGCTKKNNANTIENTQRTEDSSTLSTPKILENAISIDSNHVLQYLPNTYIEENLMQEIALLKGNLLCFCAIYDPAQDMDTLSLRLIDLDSGDLICKTQLSTSPSYPAVIQTLSDKVVVSDGALGTIHVLDAKLNKMETYHASGDMIYVNPTLTKAYCLSDTGIYVIDLENKTEEMLLENAAELFLYSYAENDVIFHYIDRGTKNNIERYATLHLDSGEIEGISVPLSDFTEAGPYLLQTTMDTNNHQLLTAYDQKGTFLSRCSLADVSGNLIQNIIWHEGANGYFFLVVTDDGHDQLYFWDLSLKMTGDSLDLTKENEKVTGDVLAPSYYEEANKLSEKYDVTIKIADLCDTDYLDKTVLQECDEEKVATGLTILKKAFSQYPEGFWNQLCYGSYRTIEIALTGEISNKEPIDGYDPTAFLQHNEDKITMVLNINESPAIIEQNFYHESSHIIDKRLEHNAKYRKNTLYSEQTWGSFNPSSFLRLNPECNGYFDSYEIMPMDYFQEEFTPYFISDYGKSFATEDRATIFETAMAKNADIFFDANNPLCKKLSYYSECIREDFDTAGWPACTVWEEPMKKTP